MSTPRWSRRWLYDSTVEVPKTTRWRRKIDSSSPTREDEVVDIRGEFSSEGFVDSSLVDLGNNTSPFKKQKLLDECLSNEMNKTQSSFNDGSQTTAGGHDASCMQKIGHEFEMTDD